MKRQSVAQVCICIPTYNSEKTIAETLKSILGQSYKNLKIFLVDNASTDKTLNIAQAFADSDSRVTIIKNDKNIGAEGNFTRCIEVASGEYTAIFHADDIYHVDIVSKQVKFMEQHQDAGAVFTMARHIDAEGRLLCIARMPKELIGKDGWDRTYCFEEIFKLILRYHNFINCPSALVRTDIYKLHVTKWDGDRFASSADLWVWLRILEKYKIGILPEPLLDYRISTCQGTYQIQRMRTKREDFFKVVDYYLQNPSIFTLLRPVDIRNYNYLVFLDNYIRATNLLIMNNYIEAKSLTRLFLKLEYFLAAFDKLGNGERIKMYLKAILIFFISRSPSSTLVAKALYKYKYHVQV